MTLAFASTPEARDVPSGAGLFRMTTTRRSVSDLGTGSGRFLDRIGLLVTMKDVNTVATAILPEPTAPLSEVRVAAALSFEALAEENIDFVFRCLRRQGLDEATA